MQAPLSPLERPPKYCRERRIEMRPAVMTPRVGRIANTTVRFNESNFG